MSLLNFSGGWKYYDTHRISKRNEVSSFLLPANRVNVHKNLFVLSKHKIPFVFARVLGVKRWLANSYKYDIGYDLCFKKKVNYTSPSHKGIRGKRGIAPFILYLSVRWEWSKSNPAVLPPLYPPNKRLGQAGLDVFRKEYILYPDRIEAQDRPARSLVAIHTTLSQLPLAGVNTHLTLRRLMSYIYIWSTHS